MTDATAPPPQSFKQALAGFPTWLRHNALKAALGAVSAGVLGWLINVWIMAVRYEGANDVPNGTPATSSNNAIGGALFWALASALVFGLVGYRQAVGGERFWSEVRTFPRTLAGLVRREGAAGRVHLLWGAAVALLLGIVVPPALGALSAVAVLAVAPTALGSIVASGLSRAWSSVLKPLGPKARPAGMEAMLAGLIGGGLALTAGFLISDRLIRLLLAIACGVAAVLLGRSIKPPSGAAVIIVIVAAIAAVQLVHAGVAHADDGGFAECGYNIRKWLTECGGSDAIRQQGLIGAIASALGVPLGWFLGNLLGQMSAAPGMMPALAPQSPVPGLGPVDPWGRPWIVQDGRYVGGNPGEVWWGGAWHPADEVAQLAQESLRADEARQRVSDAWAAAGQTSSLNWVQQRAAAEQQKVDQYGRDIAAIEQRYQQAATAAQREALAAELAQARRQAELYKGLGDRFQFAENVAKGVVFGVDKTIDVLAKLTGPVGKEVQAAYNMAKTVLPVVFDPNLAAGLRGDPGAQQAYWNTLRNTVVKLGTDKVFDAATGKIFSSTPYVPPGHVGTVLSSEPVRFSKVLDPAQIIKPAWRENDWKEVLGAFATRDSFAQRALQQAVSDTAKSYGQGVVVDRLKNMVDPARLFDPNTGALSYDPSRKSILAARDPFQQLIGFPP